MLEILVQTSTGTSSLASTTITFGSNNTAGNSIILVVGNSSTTADVSGVTDSNGNFYRKAFANQNALLGDLEVWYSNGPQGSQGIIGGPNTVTVAYTTGVSCAVIAREYYGTAYPINILDKQASTTGNSNALSSGNTNQTAQSYELLIGAGLIPLTDTFMVGNGWGNLTTLNGPAVVQVAMEDQFIASSGIYAATFGANTGLQWVCGIATFFLAPSGTTTSTSFTTSTSISSTSASSTSTSISSTSASTSMSSTSISVSITTMSTSSTSSSMSSTSTSSTSSSTSISSTSTSVSSTSTSSTSQSSTSTSTSVSSTSTSFSSTSSSMSSTSSSMSSTSTSSISSSSSTSTTTLPPPYYDYTYQEQADVTITKQFINTGIWICPANVTSVLAECWGGGGAGGGTAITGGAPGGGGGAYSNAVISVTPGTSYTVTVGTGGLGVSGANPGGSGNDTWFNSTGTVLAKAGSGGGANNGTVGSGGAAGSGVGTILFSGGNGGAGTTTSSIGSGGGGGSAGNLNNGSNGTAGGVGTAGAGGGGGPTTGGVGGAGTTSGTGLSGLTPGAGGGGGHGNPAQGGNGSNGLVQLTYTTTQNPQLTQTDLVNSYNAHQYGEVSTNDGDYFIQSGSQYLIQEYKDTHQNNTDNIYFTWKGRSTVAPLASPFLVQVYNFNSSSWQTVASQTTQPADTDFQMNVSITTNPGNYYNANNQVVFRTYQLVV